METGEFKQIFSHKLGPLPVAGWAAIGIGTLVAYRYVSAKRAAATTSVDPATGVATTDPNSLFPGDTGTDYTGQLATGTQTYGSTTTQTQVDPAPADNVVWGQRVENWLIAHGVNPPDAITAVSGYLNGTDVPLTAQQQGVLNTALAQFGVPPEGILSAPPVVTTPPATPTPITTPDMRTGDNSGYYNNNTRRVESAPAVEPVTSLPTVYGGAIADDSRNGFTGRTGL